MHKAAPGGFRGPPLDGGRTTEVLGPRSRTGRAELPDQAGFSPGSPASETKEAAVRTGAPGVVTAETVR